METRTSPKRSRNDLINNNMIKNKKKHKTKTSLIHPDARQVRRGHQKAIAYFDGILQQGNSRASNNRYLDFIN